MLKGIGASSGISIGKAVIFAEHEITYTPVAVNDTESEIQRFKKAMEQFIEKTKDLAEKLAKNAGEKEAQILKGHILMIQDPFMCGEIEKLIQGGTCAESAVEQICDKFAQIFSAADDELTKQRATDVIDLKKRLLKTLLHIEDTNLSTLPADTILVVHDLTPSMTAGIDKNHVIGFLTEVGGTTSHSAILARAMEIPAVLSIDNITKCIKSGDTVILDGTAGIAIINASEEQISEYRQKREIEFSERKALKKYIGQKTVTKDGKQVELVCNIGNPQDVEQVLAFDGEGIGLFRTEFLFMDRTSPPSEEEQFEAYRNTALKMKGKPVIIRTLDIGGDKAVSYLNMKHEDNPFLGYRAVRYCLGNPDLYAVQLRALLRASAYGDIRIMIPLVSCLDELKAVKSNIQEIKTQLDKENISYNKDIPVGVMIETPAAVLIANLLAKEADFFSIGTNDLTQYTMAVDRGNADVAYLYSAFNPAVLRSIRYIITCAKDEKIPVGMCGEAASDKRLIPLLLAFGLDEFSVSATSVLTVRKTISEWSLAEAQTYAEKIMSCTSLSEVLQALK
ncbi:MAG: phosphoenolpyruvate--protein phosphotransferase [Acutalibacteraceae bacterium]